MHKLSGTRSSKNNKSCRILHNESNKIEFAFFWFFYDFLQILQDSANHNHYWSYNFSLRPLELFGTPQICPQFTQNSLDRCLATQLVPGADGGGGSPESGGSGGGFSRGSCGEGVGAHQCSIWGRGRGWDGPGEWARRRLLRARFQRGRGRPVTTRGAGGSSEG
jgi:hypothetical protein